MVERSQDLHISKAESQRHAPVYIQVCARWLTLSPMRPTPSPFQVSCVSYQKASSSSTGSHVWSQ